MEFKILLKRIKNNSSTFRLVYILYPTRTEASHVCHDNPNKYSSGATTTTNDNNTKWLYQSLWGVQNRAHA